MYVSVSWAKKWCLSELEAIQCRTGKIDFPELRAFLFKWWNQTGYTINVYVYRISLECVTENRHKAKGLEFGHFVEKNFGEEQPTTFCYAENRPHLKCLLQSKHWASNVEHTHEIYVITPKLSNSIENTKTKRDVDPCIHREPSWIGGFDIYKTEYLLISSKCCL